MLASELQPTKPEAWPAGLRPSRILPARLTSRPTL